MFTKNEVSDNSDNTKCSNEVIKDEVTICKSVDGELSIKRCDKPNREFKDSLFSYLFSTCDKAIENFLALYKFLTGQNIKPKKVTKVSSENLFYTGPINDVSMVIDNKLVVLIEQQSTINPNIALRFLEYICAIYSEVLKNIGNFNKYSSTKQLLPMVDFYVIYNGQADYKEKQVRLSDLFDELDVAEYRKYDKNRPFKLDLLVDIVNINVDLDSKDKKELDKIRHMQQTPVLYGYATFISIIRKFKKEDGNNHSLDFYLNKAIDYCISNNILKDVMLENKEKLYKMIFDEFNKEEYESTLIAESRAEGKAEGKAETSLEIAKKALKKNMPLEDIMYLTGFSKETLLQLKKEMEKEEKK